MKPGKISRDRVPQLSERSVEWLQIMAVRHVGEVGAEYRRELLRRDGVVVRDVFEQPKGDA